MKMMRLLLISMATFCAIVSTVSSSCSPSDLAALQSIRTGLTESSLGIFNSWVGTDCCVNWYGINCDPTRNPVSLGSCQDRILKKSEARKKRKSLSSGCSRSSSSATKALFQYETLLSDDNPNRPLTELVDVGLIRLVPSSEIDDRPFEPGDKVDAFHLDAWWPGVVIKLEEDEYTVGFLDLPDLLVLRRSDLRSHWDLTDGVWV